MLRFFGYFVEDVPDSAEEAWRVRRVAILHHLEDGTTQISEPRSERSVSPGFLVGRSRIPKPGSKKYEDGSFLALGPEDLGVGRSITANGREIHIVDADEFTRTHMLQRGAPQGAPLPVPENPIDSYRAQRLKPSGLTRSDPQSPTRFAEALLGRAPSTKRLQQFLEGNSRVLRYFAVWDDWTASTATDTVRRPFKIHYYLEDDTVEILEVRDGNVGREFYRFVARAPLPKGPGCTPLGGEVAKEACVGSEDLRIGATLKVHGRAFFIHDADDFTKQWCRVSCLVHAAAAPLTTRLAFLTAFSLALAISFWFRSIWDAPTRSLHQLTLPCPKRYGRYHSYRRIPVLETPKTLNATASVWYVL